VLDNVSFTVRQGETLTIVGPSGAGKTTLINLLLKFYTPQSGAIYLDKYDIGGLDHEWLRKQIGIVSQDIFLFNDTIENNIKYGNAAATREEVVRAAKKAHIHEDIEAFPKGYDTIVGERGTMLSVGQRQRVSIARAFLKDMPILVLDEPTSALDVATEKHLIGSLKELAKGRTTLIISHRLSLADIADEVIVLDGGRIMGGGTRAKPLDIKINETP
jgi:subfamily B ATP-binding cassette protein MsbA